MAQEAKVAINIASEFTGKKAFKQADAAVANLGKNLKRALIGAGFAAFGKSAVSAFVVADRTAQSFANTMKNIGLGQATADVMAMTDAMEMQYGVAASRLIPAYQRFAVITRSTADSQQLLNLAMDVAAGTSNSLETVTNAFTRALNGNNASLGKLGSNLTKTDLKTLSLNDNLKKLADNYSGAATTASETLANKITRLGLAFNKAKEYIGGGLVEAGLIITGSANIEQLQTNIINFGRSAARVLITVGTLIHDNITFLKQLGITLGAIWTSTKIYAGIAAFLKVGEGLIKFYRTLRNVSVAAAIAQMAAINPIAGVVGGVALVAGIIAANKALDKFESTVKKTNKVKFTMPKFNKLGDPAYDAKQQDKITKAKKAQLKLDKEAAALKKATAILGTTGKVFDIDLIQNVAALQGKLTENETLRLKLQQAILLENSKAAAELGQELLSVQLAAVMAGTVDPFGKWTDSAMSAMQAIKDLIAELAKLGTPAKTTGQLLLAQDYTAALLDAQDPSFDIAQEEFNNVMDMFKELSNLPKLPTVPYTASTGNFTYGQGNPLAVQVFVDPTAMAYGINAQVVNNTANGNSNTYSTIQSFAGGR